MKKLISYLQNPYIKIFITPLALILFGALLGVNHAQETQWLSLILLYLLALSSQLVKHCLHLAHDQNHPIGQQKSILWTCEIILGLSSILLMIRQHWIISILILLYIVYIHISYYPYNISNSIYILILAVFYEAFILNIIAYYSQVSAINTEFLFHLIPVAIVYTGVYIQTFKLKDDLSIYEPSPIWPRLRMLGIILSFLALGFGFYYALPSNSYYILQILFVLVTGLTMIPMLVPTRSQKETQRKINYFSTILLIFTLFYSLATLY